LTKTFVVKIGTNAIVNDLGGVDSAVLKNLSAGIIAMRGVGHNVLLVSSGAVASGKNEFDANVFGKISRVELSQIRSAVGQPRLMKTFRDEFKKYNIPVAQGLVTRADFASRSRQLAMRNILEKMFVAGILPIMNENDFLTPEELDFSDNDQLAAFFAGMLQAESLVILSNISGLFTAHPEEKGAKKIDTVSAITPDIESYVSDKKSSGGMGGMKSKIETAKMLGKLGIEMTLANSREENVLQKILEKKSVGTHFLAERSKKESGVRVWLAAGAHEKGSITLDCPLENFFKEKKSGISILGVGVKNIVGDFLEHDCIGLFSESGKKIGRGMAKISAEKMKNSLQNGDTKGVIFVHADEVFLF
jgi:glutamate 5-kinase